MRILIPTFLSTSRTVGVAEYLVNLIENLQKVDSKNEYYIITAFFNSYMFNLQNKNFHEIKVHIYDLSRMFLRLNYYAWQFIYFKGLIKKLEIDIVHFPCPWFIPPNIKSVVTVHDMTEFHIQKYGRLNNYIKKKMIKKTFEKSSDIIVVSKSTLKDVSQYFKGNIYTIYNGAEGTGQKVNQPEILRRYNLLTQKYFVFIGTLQKHKNISNLIDAYNIFSGFHTGIKLVLIGKKDNALNEINDKIKKFKLENSVQVLGYLSEEEKNIILQETFGLLYPSLYEGFGFPILDAQLRGIPVITSNISSMPEVSGNGALLVNPKDPENIAMAMSELVKNSELKIELINEGFANVKRFSWKKCAEQTLEIYKKVHVNSRQSP